MIDCPNCGNSYEKDLKQCPTCKADNPLVARTDDVFRKVPIKTQSYSKGIIIGVSTAVAIIVAIIFIGGVDYNAILASLNQSVQNAIPSSDDTEMNDQQTANEDSSTNSEQVADVKVQNLLATRLFLSPGDSRAFQINIPSEAVTRLEGSIRVSGGEYVSVEFLKSNGASYCQQPSQCSYNVYVEASSNRDNNNEIDIGVKSGDVLQLIVTKIDSSELQIVDINLYVSYSGLTNRIGEGSENESIEPAVIEITHEESDEPQPVEEESIPIVPPSDGEETSIEDYRQYALQLINEDRKRVGLLPVALSDNEAAQIHAENVLSTRYISHWMTNGEKPYMTYTRYGGTGSVGQNVAISGDMAYYQDCTSGYYYCQVTEPYSHIEEHEYGMIYEDAVCCENGHRDNILDPNHTHVSIGIAYDDYIFVLVQNFEDNYIEFTRPITIDNRNIQLIGQIPTGTKIYGINIFYDESPTSKTYQNNKFQSSYSMGEMIAGVTEPEYYYEDIVTITANKWNENKQSIDIRFSLASIDDEPGVYTIVTWLEDFDGAQFPVTTYSVFVQ